MLRYAINTHSLSLIMLLLSAGFGLEAIGPMVTNQTGQVVVVNLNGRTAAGYEVLQGTVPPGETRRIADLYELSRATVNVQGHSPVIIAHSNMTGLGETQVHYTVSTLPNGRIQVQADSFMRRIVGQEGSRAEGFRMIYADGPHRVTSAVEPQPDEGYCD